MRFVVLKRIVVELAAIDVEEAAAVAETIADAGTRAWGFLQIADRLPDDDRNARPHSSSAACNKQKSLPTRASECSRWPKWPSDCLSAARLRGRTHCSRKGADRQRTHRQKGFQPHTVRRETGERGFPGRAANCQGFCRRRPGKPRTGQHRVSHRRGEPVGSGAALDPGGPNAPARARRGNLLEAGRGRPGRRIASIEGMPWIDQKPEVFINLAFAKARDEGAARRAIEKGVAGLDKILRERPERYMMIAGSLLPAIERIDPALLPEMLWRDVTSRPPAVDPRVARGYSPTGLVAMLAWYDREVAAAIFEPTRKQIEHTDPAELANWRYEFLAWSMFHPRAAAARLEQTPINSDMSGLWRCAGVCGGIAGAIA